MARVHGDEYACSQRVEIERDHLGFVNNLGNTTRKNKDRYISKKTFDNVKWTKGLKF